MKWIFILVFFVIFIFPADAKVIDFKYNYQDYLGDWYVYNNENLAAHPYYTVTENENNYTISRLGTTVNLPKRTWIDYEFYPDRIRPVVTIQNYSQINGLVTKVNSTAWYLSAPWSASYVKSVTDNLIDMGVFKRTLDFSVSDSNTSCGEACPSYSIVPKVVGGDIRLYFNPQTYSDVVWPLKISENTITVSNATTQGWSGSNVSLNGSRFTGDGKLAIGYLNNISDGVVGCWNFDETTGTILRNCNNANGSINVTNQGTWNGNATLNYTTDKIGNAGLFDGANDYVVTGNDASLNIIGNRTISLRFNVSSTANISRFPVMIYKQTAGGYIRMQNDGKIRVFWNGLSTQSLISDSSYNNSVPHFLVATYNGTNISLTIDSTTKVINSSGTSTSTAGNLYIGGSTGEISANDNFPGALDEVKIWNRALSPQEVVILHNTPIRTEAMPVFLNQTANASKQINRVRISYTGHDLLNNASIFANKSGVAGRTLIQANATPGTWYDVPASLQNQTMDFAVEFAGNGSNTVFFESLEWDETSSNLVNFTFSNASISESQIYQSSQATRIKVNVNDSDGHIDGVNVGVTLNGTETNYSMSGGNDTWTYDFKSGVPGTYTITHFYATDNASGTNSTTSNLQFTVVPLLTSGQSGQVAHPNPTTAPTPGKTPLFPEPTAPVASLADIFSTGLDAFNELPEDMQWGLLILLFLGATYYTSNGRK